MAEEAWAAAARYEGYRLAAREATSESLAGLGLGDVLGGRFSLSGIGDRELADWKTWPSPHFDWPGIVTDFRPYLSRFEIGIWQDGRLLGMAIGRPSKGLTTSLFIFWRDDGAKIPFADGSPKSRRMPRTTTQESWKGSGSG